MRWWIGVVLALLLSGCGGWMVTQTENEGQIYHDPAESIYYSPGAESNQTMRPAQARKALPELLLHHGEEAGYRAFPARLNDHFITQVRIRRTGRIEISTRRETLTLPFKDLNADVVKVPNGNWPDILFVINLTGKAQIHFTLGTSYDPAFFEKMKSIADALYVLQQAAMHDADDAAFSETARTYREATTKPVLPEAARRLRVQAEDAVQDKNFEAAADLYEEATHVVPWWPVGHFNYAVILSETGDYSLAAREMKRYLLLVPDAADAQTAQDNIYKWERRAGTPN